MPRPGRPWAETNPTENWAGVSDPKVRRRLQNRLNARAHRRRRALQREEGQAAQRARAGADFGDRDTVTPPLSRAESVASVAASPANLPCSFANPNGPPSFPASFSSSSTTPPEQIFFPTSAFNVPPYNGLYDHDFFVLGIGTTATGIAPCTSQTGYDAVYDFEPAAAPHAHLPATYRLPSYLEPAAVGPHRGGVDVTSSSTSSSRSSPAPDAGLLRSQMSGMARGGDDFRGGSYFPQAARYGAVSDSDPLLWS